MSANKKGSSGNGLAVCVLAGLVLAGTHGHALSSAAAHLDSASAVPIPAGGAYTPRSWARTFLAAIPEPRTPCNLAAVLAWEAAEGGHWHNAAARNPLDTTQREPGSWAVNSVGVQAFPTWQEGLQANVTVIRNGWYGPVLAALAAGNNAQAVANAVSASRWGTEPYSATC
jgi:hypothetical protein